MVVVWNKVRVLRKNETEKFKILWGGGQREKESVLKGRWEEWQINGDKLIPQDSDLAKNDL